MSKKTISKKSQKVQNSQTFQLKISLDDAKPPIWRRVLIPSNFTLHDLHLVIQSSFNWFNYHLYGFDLPNPNGKNRWDQLQAVDITGGQWGDFIEDYQIDSQKILVANTLNLKAPYLHYEYDFGDGWRHTIKLEKIIEGAIKKPKLLKVVNYAPVEDCGALWGWYGNLEVLKNYPEKPSEEQKEILEWMAELIPELDEENPRAFDPTKVSFDEIAERVEDYKSAELEI